MKDLPVQEQFEYLLAQTRDPLARRHRRGRPRGHGFVPRAEHPEPPGHQGGRRGERSKGQPHGDSPDGPSAELHPGFTKPSSPATTLRRGRGGPGRWRWIWTATRRTRRAASRGRPRWTRGKGSCSRRRARRVVPRGVQPEAGQGRAGAGALPRCVPEPPLAARQVGRDVLPDARRWRTSCASQEVDAEIGYTHDERGRRLLTNAWESRCRRRRRPGALN